MPGLPADARARARRSRRRAGPAGLGSLRGAVYARSYLGYGAVAMESRVKQSLLDAAAQRAHAGADASSAGAAAGGATGGAVVNPCGFAGHAEESEAAEAEAEADAAAVRLAGGGDFEGCVAALRAALAAQQQADGTAGTVALPPAALAGASFALASLTCLTKP
jgi:hypothetical protein